MASLRDWMTTNRFEKYLVAFEEELGVQTVSDLAFVTPGDLEQLGVMPVQRRRFELLLSTPVPPALLPAPVTAPATAPGTLPALPAALATAHPSVALNEMTIIRAGAAGSSGQTSADVLLDNEGGCANRSVRDAGSPSRTRRRTSAQEDLDLTDGSDTDSDYQLEYESSGSDSAGINSTKRVTKRRKYVQGPARRLLDEKVLAEGRARPHLPDRYGNGTARCPSEAASSVGTSRMSIDANGRCNCQSVLLSLSDRLAPARRTARERRRAEISGDCKGAQMVYNYARLGTLILDLLYDGRGNLVVHEKCARQFIGVSNSWLAQRHKQAVQAAKTPVIFMSKSEIASSPNSEGLIKRIIRPDTCLLSVSQFYCSSSDDARFKVVAIYSDHALSGRPSNRMKSTERELFVSFVRSHRTPTGRTPDKNGRYHGAAYYLDAKWKVMRMASDKEKGDSTRHSFSAGFIEALTVSGQAKVNGEVPVRWLKEYFGSTLRVDGRPVPSEEHTTLYPHKTDACSTCECLRADLRSARQVLKRHEQQSDQGSLNRQQVIAEVKQTIADLEAAHEAHEEEAACAVQHHRRCVADAAQRYGHLSVLFYELYTINETVTERPVNVDDDKQEALVRAASHDWFDVSSDYQQDKSVPVWNESPQPGPTYFMSGHTHYVHIFCAESCGSANGRPRFSRNNVYTRSEMVGGAKSSDDTMSTLCDLLLGSTTIGVDDPPVYRTGCGPEE
ncbi:hypothetical protein BU14_0245s0017 [Porphyra umbilicalis]|uniref:SAM domain-containing protein n=1 Tax=Porphyra umbilicalis TaxID=2786 RepID=A0A1X6P397_PORUM|nr:hypothetical protein BU14_0245s0017 [Porphyra umbilicalis]|eukprot:OSX75235.1 hypothetical protein BU14_0245s0017 [Porphyra umbilicalis]